MPIEIKKYDEYELPPAGIFNIVCCEMCEGMVKGKDRQGAPETALKLIFSFEIDAPMKDGRRFIITRGAEFYVESGLTAKNAMGKFLNSWGGGKEPFTEEQLIRIAEAVNMKKYVGANATAAIIHKTSQASGYTYAVIDKIYPSQLPESARLKPSPQYTPWEKRQGQFNQRDQASTSAQAPTPTAQVSKDKDPVPF